ncbi:MAG: T9SS type A sorting domain-containing protein [Bacteroidia bacterium]|nr:T9SS type A sorting domain-containing protein [Bacteroidia bacterium]
MKSIILNILFVLIVSYAFAQPANDECAGAIPLTVGATCSYTATTNALATASAGVPAPGCANYLGGDVWYSVVVPASGHLIFDSQAGVVTDAGMAIYSGACGSLSLINCDDDNSNNGLMAMIDQAGLTAGSTIYIRVWEYGNNNNGSFSICVYDPGLGACASVTSIATCGTNQTVTSGGGSGIWNSGLCGSGTPGKEKIYSYVAPSTNSYYISVTTDGSWMSYAFQEGTCESSGWNCISRISTSGAYGPFNLTAGLTYYFLVDDEDAASSTHIFNIVCPETPGNYQHSTTSLQGTYLGDCMVNTCAGVYTDDGLGGAGYYSPNINGVYRTFCPDAPGKCLQATITSMDIYYNAGWTDYLFIKDGPTQGSPTLWVGAGTLATPITGGGTWANPIVSTDQSGCLTFQFYSSAVNERPGWSINLSCNDCGTTLTNNDCITATPICGATNMSSASTGPGITSVCGGCNLSENYSSWYYFEITNSGRLSLDLKPEDFFEDYDFALYQATNCTSLGNPVSCTYAASPTYCNNISDGASYYISNVSFNTINNTSTENTDNHSNYTSISTNVNSGSSYNLSVTVVGNGMEVVAWFDWDKSLTFDAGEYYVIGTGGPGVIGPISITIPPTARAGKTGFRIYTARGGYPPAANACTSYANGEIEDYAIFINDGTHCSNNVKDADETGVDCGGVDCVSCAASNWPTNTGTNNVATDVSEDVTGNSWVSSMPVNAGESYYLMVNNWSPGAAGFDLIWNFSEGGAMDCAITLPIELSYFNAFKKNNFVQLEWTTVSETNNDYFTVLKSYDANIYKPISKVNSAGNSNTAQYYSAVDLEALNQTTYYRLKQTDKDGKFSYSDVKVLNPDSFTETLNSLNAYYASSTQEIFVSFNGVPNENYYYTIYDMTGRPIKKNVIKASNSAKGYVVIGTNDISQGIYSFILNDKQTVIQQKLIITK